MARPNKPQTITKVFWLAIAFVLACIIAFVRYDSSAKSADRIPFSSDPVDDYLAHFRGRQECGIASRDLYIAPTAMDDKPPKHTLYCRNRGKLLEAMSEGGRHGFEQPYFPAGCHYRWYSTTEICMILERFDAIVFIGDTSLKHIYAAFNMLLREDLAIGGLQQWDVQQDERSACHCDNQVMRAECLKHIITDSQVSNNGQNSRRGSQNICSRTPHSFLPISDSPASEDLHSKFMSFLPNDPDAMKPVPVIHSLSLATSLSWPSATSSMDEWVSLADSSGRNVPFLWVGPNAAGHLKPPGQILNEGNNAIWHYTLQTMKEANARELDALAMYNLTLQANSWDGSNYGLRVGLVQAMMVINWLSRVDST